MDSHTVNHLWRESKQVCLGSLSLLAVMQWRQGTMQPGNKQVRREWYVGLHLKGQWLESGSGCPLFLEDRPTCLHSHSTSDFQNVQQCLNMAVWQLQECPCFLLAPVHGPKFPHCLPTCMQEECSPSLCNLQWCGYPMQGSRRGPFAPLLAIASE